MKTSPHGRPYSEFPNWAGLCPPNTWCRVSPDAFQGILPASLLQKTEPPLVLSSDGAGVTTYVVDLPRIDPPASAIDQELYILAFDHEAGEAYGYFIHHGNWPGRTIRPSLSFLKAAESSGIADHFPFSFVPGGSSGPMSDIAARQDANDFWQEIKRIRSGHSGE